MKMREDMDLLEMWKLFVGVLVQNQVTPMMAAEWLLEQVEQVDEEERQKLALSQDTHEKLFDELIGLTWHIADPSYVEMMRGRG